jgi:hypothetical protein
VITSISLPHTENVTTSIVIRSWTKRENISPQPSDLSHEASLTSPPAILLEDRKHIPVNTNGEISLGYVVLLRLQLASSVVQLRIRHSSASLDELIAGVNTSAPEHICN